MGICCSQIRPDRIKEEEEEGEAGNGHMGVDYFQRDKTDVSKYICQQLDNATIVKQAGELNGQAFHIESCNGCTILLMDHTAAVTIDLCNDCQIIVGPCKGSVFVRESKRCHIMASCQQFRARDTVQSTFQLHCTTQPVIENCSSIKFGCFSCNYPELKDHLAAANISPLNNNWYSVHDFTPQSGNWVTLKQGRNSPPLGTDDTSSLLYNIKSTSIVVVPDTRGTNFQDEYTNMCLVVLLEDSQNERALKFIEGIKTKLLLLVTKDTKMRTNGLQQFFSGNTAAPPDLKDGTQVEFLLLSGSECIQLCNQILHEDPQNTPLNSYCSPDEAQASIDYQRLCHLIDSGIMNNN